jgi:sarcosine oxidase gamma subunit
MPQIPEAEKEYKKIQLEKVTMDDFSPVKTTTPPQRNSNPQEINSSPREKLNSSKSSKDISIKSPRHRRSANNSRDFSQTKNPTYQTLEVIQSRTEIAPSLNDMNDMSEEEILSPSSPKKSYSMVITANSLRFAENELKDKISHVVDNLHPDEKVESARNYLGGIGPDERVLWSMFRKTESPSKTNTPLSSARHHQRMYSLNAGTQPYGTVDKNTVHLSLCSQINDQRVRKRFESLVDQLDVFSIQTNPQIPSPTRPEKSDFASSPRSELNNVLHKEFSGNQRAYLLSEITRLEFVNKKLEKSNAALENSFALNNF